MPHKFGFFSPKRSKDEANSSLALFPYYAGFSQRFVSSVLSSFNFDRNAIVCDPWNGSGTTTTESFKNGFQVMGFDLNPAMVVISKARLLSCNEAGSLIPIAHDISEKVKQLQGDFTFSEDPLLDWMAPNSVNCVRKIEYVIQKLLVDEKQFVPMRERGRYSELSTLASFFYVALFRSVRLFMSKCLSSNPTWFKKPRSKLNRMRPDFDLINRVFAEELFKIIKVLNDMSRKENSHTCYANIDVASSLSLPVKDSQINFVISSPPYCTRIDYAVATLPELCVLGYSNSSFEKLRRSLIGSTLTDVNRSVEIGCLGSECMNFLEKVKSHNSKASGSYYFRMHIQYFNSIYKSLVELRRAIVPGGKCVLVVQDSYYKDIHNNLPNIIIDMATNNEFNLEEKFDFMSTRSMASINNATKNYRKKINSVESVLVFCSQKKIDVKKDTVLN
ncbi:hypothetical protein [Desulfolutivibrio sulfoxidireducens]|uniref:hypothetical protein n=1 Tax=Desulfolutivibrio sulfoxidireducens TaxID=2773299 RepID=UPI00159E670A|nr:hypothetical protein [Desulfolutivibrio sulfoxidireducens]QLA18635.1 hypothetical protein GD604_02250 [Desulfolutivibrio sulfoxidireducens]